jgi:hypothetical protein
MALDESADRLAATSEAVIPSIHDVFKKFCHALASASSLQGSVTHRDAGYSALGDNRTAWTNVILNRLIDIGAGYQLVSWPERYFYGYGSNAIYKDSQRRERGAHLLDLCWTNYPASRRAWEIALERREPIKSPRIVLACECEWGGQQAILDDFAKIADVKAPLKMMLFSTRPNYDWNRLVWFCKTAARPIDENEKYLLVGWPSDCEWSNRMTLMHARVFTAHGDYDPKQAAGK